VHNIMLDWQQAAALGTGLLVVRAASSQAGNAVVVRVGEYLGEAGVIAALFAVWQWVGSKANTSATGAYSRGHWILRTEHDIGLPSEHWVQGLINPHPLIEQACNIYYDSVHFPAMGIFLVWLFTRHRREYGQIRTVIILLTLSCLAVQLITVAPPRLLPGAGFTDTAEKFHQSVYYIDGVAANALSAMPSVHVGWAVLIGWAVVSVSDSRWRWLALLDPILTTFVVVATANHYWLDGIVAIALLVVAVLVTRLAARLLHRAPSRAVNREHERLPDSTMAGAGGVNQVAGLKPAADG
jgi:PAP2 superfamily